MKKTSEKNVQVNIISSTTSYQHEQLEKPMKNSQLLPYQGPYLNACHVHACHIQIYLLVVSETAHCRLVV